MVNIDTVYQKVLVLSNKEQRGYITPQEFNLLADKAQLEIFNSYFHDIKTGLSHPTKNEVEVFDPVEIVREKLNPFLQRVTTTIDEDTVGLGTLGDAWTTSNNYIESVFIDGGHEYQFVKEDIEHLYPKICDGGIIAGDDWNWHLTTIGGIQKAVKEFFGDRPIIDRETWIYRK